MNTGSNAFMAAIFGTVGIVYLIVFVIIIVGMWKMFEKAGKPGWAAIVPIYNVIVLIEMTGKPVWWILLFLIPCANIVFAVWITNLISKSFGQSEGFTIGLCLLPFIFYPLLGFGSYKYLGPSAAEAQGLKTNFTDYKNPFDNQNPPNLNPPN